jgi:adenosylcobinamide amidohydrolase
MRARPEAFGMRQGDGLTNRMTWEALRTLTRSESGRGGVTLRRHGRFLVADLREPHQVLSTSVRNGGLVTHVRHLVNHQSCEGTGHDARFKVITEQGQEAYHDAVCAEIDLPSDLTVTMGTAANMSYATIVTVRDEDVAVTAVVTAGVQSNAVCAGDPASWRETASGIARVEAKASGQTLPTAAAAASAGAKVGSGDGSEAGAGAVAPAPVVAGTINTMLLIDTPLTPAALARVVVTMVEGKGAALQRLAVPSCYSADLATGTGTDQYCVAAPLGAPGGRLLTTASPHMKFGEIIGVAVRDATLEALRWQNGLEASYTRGLFHALGRYGIKQQTIFDELKDSLDPADLELLRKNSNAAFYEPLVGAAAHALGTVLDRVRHGTLPASAAPDAVVHQAATLAASLAASPDRWAEFRARLHEIAHRASAHGNADVAASAPAGFADPKPLVLAAIALGWSAKWRPR